MDLLIAIALLCHTPGMAGIQYYQLKCQQSYIKCFYETKKKKEFKDVSKEEILSGCVLAATIK